MMGMTIGRGGAPPRPRAREEARHTAAQAKKPVGAKIQLFERDGFLQKSVFFSIVDVTEFGAARIQP